MGLNVELLDKSFQVILPRGEEFGKAFYQQLFQNSPELQGRFTQDNSMPLVKSLVYIMGQIKAGNMDDLTDYLKKLGGRHNNYQTESADYAKVGGALLATLEVFCGDVWDDDVKQAWADAFGVIQSIMETGAREALEV